MVVKAQVKGSVSATKAAETHGKGSALLTGRPSGIPPRTSPGPSHTRAWHAHNQVYARVRTLRMCDMHALCVFMRACTCVCVCVCVCACACVWVRGVHMMCVLLPPWAHHWMTDGLSVSSGMSSGTETSRERNHSMPVSGSVTRRSTVCLPGP